MTHFCFLPRAKFEKPNIKPPQPTSSIIPSEGIKQDIFSYVSNKIGIWTKEDAEIELGQPIDRRDAVFNNSVAGDIYKYKSPATGFESVELNIARSTKKLAAAYFYYGAPASWASVREKLGKNYKKKKLPNGRPDYVYQFQNRQVSVIVDSADNVYNIGVW